MFTITIVGASRCVNLHPFFGAMSIPKALFAVSLMAIFASVLVGCGGDASYSTCDHDKIKSLAATKNNALQKCVNPPPSSYDAFESCACDAYKPFAKEMLKYKEPCSKEGTFSVGPLKLTWGGIQHTTNCGVSGIPSSAAANFINEPSFGLQADLGERSTGANVASINFTSETYFDPHASVEDRMIMVSKVMV